MFRKLVSNLSYSPALVEQMSFYAKRLSKEEATRKAGLIFTIIALSLQYFAVFSPPEAANAASANDLIYGGISSKSDLLNHYDNDAKYRKVLDFAGITRDELSATTIKEINNLSNGKGTKAWKSWGYQSFFSSSQGEVKYNADGVTVFSRPNYLFNSTDYEQSNGKNIKVLYGKSDKLGEFGIMFNCGNIFTPNTPSPPPPNPPTPAEPSVVCTNLETLVHSKTERRFAATAKTINDAKISSYKFIIKDVNDTTIKAFSYRSSGTGVTTGNIRFEPGKYTVQVYVLSNEKEFTSDSCIDKFDISIPGIKITKLVNNRESVSVDLMQEFTYSIVIENTGSVDLRDLTVNDNSPDHTNFVASPKGGKIEDGTWSVNVDVLRPGESKTFEIVAVATARLELGRNVIKNTACVEASQLDESENCDDASITVPEELIEVCDLLKNSLVTIVKSQFDSSRHSKNTEDCQLIQVCDLDTDTIITIRKTQLENEAYSQDLDDCKKIQVCNLTTGEVTVIAKNDFQESKHSNNAADCVPDVIYSKSAANLSNNSADATSIRASSGDQIRYSVTVENVGDSVSQVDLVEHLSDILEYSTILDPGGGVFKKDLGILRWASVSLQPGEKQTRQFTVELASDIPAAARGLSNPVSFDCTMTNTFGNSTNVSVNCPVEKQVEQVISQLPKTGQTSNLVFAGSALSIATFFYARSRQLKKEVRLIRKDINTGLI